VRTFGRLRFGNHRGRTGWGIDQLEPHVAVAFKRLFPKVHHAATVHFLTDNDDTRADIKWFMDRYPLEANENCHELLRQGAERMARKIAERGLVLDLNWTPPTDTAGFKPGKAPYFYQEQAITIALAQGGLLLGDDVGLGKTNSALGAAVRGAPLPMACVVQSHVVDQWVKRVKDFTTLRVHKVRTRTPYTLPVADIYVFSYHLISGWSEVIERGTFKSVVYDEIQELRHGDTTDKGQAARRFTNNAMFKMGLSATPVFNMGNEMHRIMSYLNEDLLGEREEFYREWVGSEGAVKDPDALGSFLKSSGWVLRRDEDDPAVDRSMPPPNVIEHELDFDRVAMAKEEEILHMLATTVMTGRFQDAGRASRELDVKMRHLTGVTKAKSVAAYVKMLLRERPRVVLAGWHRDVYDIWRYALREFDPVHYTGSETAAGKARNVQRFLDPRGSRVLMMSLRTGAGLDGLQYKCRDVVFGELDWSPQVHKQLIGRVRRPGQPHQVDAHYLHVNGGSDPVLMAMLGVKSDQGRGIMDPGKALPKQVNETSRIKAMAQMILEGA